MNIERFAQDLIEQLRTVLGTALDTEVRLVPAAMRGTGWRARMAAADGTAVAITVGAEGAAALTRAMGKPGGANAPSVPGAVRDLFSNALTALPAAAESGVEMPLPESGEWAGERGDTVVGLHGAGLDSPLVISIGPEPAPAESRTLATAADAMRNPGRVGVLLDIDLPLVVRFGCTDLTLKALARLGPGSLISLSRAPEDPVEVLVGGRIVARGEVVVVSGSYGIRITDVVGEPQMAAVEA